MTATDKDGLDTVTGRELAEFKKDVLAYIEEKFSCLGSDVNEFKTYRASASELVGVLARDQKRLKDYIERKESKDRNDLDLMVLKLREGIGDFEGGMDYKQVQDAFSLEAPIQAYRVMYQAYDSYPQDFTLHKNKEYRKGKLILRLRKGI